MSLFWVTVHVLLSESSKMHVGISDENPNASIPVRPVFLVLFSLTTSIVKESGLFSLSSFALQISSMLCI